MLENELDPSAEMPMTETHRQAYERLEPLRESYLTRGRECSKLTIPRLLKEAGANGNTPLPTPFQSMGPRGVNNLSAKLLMALFPPNIPFFKFRVEPYARELEAAANEGREETPQTTIEKSLVKAEQAVQAELETSGWRVNAYETIQHVVATGNCLVYMPEGGTKARNYKLDQYVVERDPMGHPIEIIVKERMSERMLSADLKDLLKTMPSAPQGDRTAGSNPTYDLFTRCLFDGETKMWHCSQQLETADVPGSYGKYTEEDFPYIPVRGYSDSGEHYSRSYVEDYLGDLISLEGLSQAIVEYAAACANVKFLVKPASLTDKDELANLPNGGYGDGTKDDVTVVALDKFADFNVSAQTAEEIKKQLALVFLLNTAIQRAGERVTAEEIRFMAEELETALGGAYSLLSLEFQLPLVNLLVARMKANNTLPKLPEKIVKPAIVTGIEAIGRGNDASRLMDLAAGIRETFGEQAAASILNPLEWAGRLAVARGIRSEGLIRTAEQQQGDQQQATMQNLIEKLGPEFMRQMGNVGAAGGVPEQAPA